MVTVLTLTDPQRRLLNVVFDRPNVRTGTALLDADCGMQELEPLTRAELLAASDDDGDVDIVVTADRWLREETWLHLTAAGGHWVNTGENLFLRTLDAMTRTEGKFNLRKALLVADQERIRTTVEAGYATVVRDETGKPARLTARMFDPVRAWTWALVATPKIRQVLGPR